MISRSCPGKEFANASLFTAIAMSIAVFDVKRAIGEEERKIDSYLEWSKTAVRFVIGILPLSLLRQSYLILAILFNSIAKSNYAQKRQRHSSKAFQTNFLYHVATRSLSATFSKICDQNYFTI